MPNLTKNYGLKKPLSEEFYDVNVQNENMDIIDEELGKCANIVITNEVPEDTAFWIDPDDVSAEEAHLTNMNNPHNVTREQIGAAPSGYGLGTTGIDVSDANHVFEVFRNGWFRTFSSTANTAVAHGAGIALVYDANRAFHLLAKTTAGTMRTRYTPNSDGVFVEDLINPPMTAGYQYQTIERWNGKTVYTKLVSVGALGASGSTTCKLNTGGANIIGFEAIGCTETGSYVQFPRVDKTGNITARCYIQNDEVWFGCIGDNTDVTSCYVTIWYTKE